MGVNTDGQSLPSAPRNHAGLGRADSVGESRVVAQSFRNDPVRDRVGVYGDDDVVDPDCYGETEDGWGH